MFEIIPAIDIIEGKCVRLSQGDFSQKIIYNEDPLDVALEFEDLGIKKLHLVDLDGAKTGKIVNLKVLDKIASKTKLIIDFGGGIKTDEDIKLVFDYGATKATIGSLAVKKPELFKSWISRYGSSKIFLGTDVKDEKVAIGGWLENTDIDMIEFIKKNAGYGIKEIFCTDISKDGLLQGPSTELYIKIMEECPEIQLIASGGVSCMEDIEELKNIGCTGVIIGKAIYEGKIDLREVLSNLY
jgi:phosphoribosylformimino-5-aminoimidazole carboxamide ribotide isomerase